MSEPSATPDSCRYEDVAMAAHRIRSGVVKTPTTRATATVSGCIEELHLKHEHRQKTGSFKERGALNALLLLPAEGRKNGVIAASAGNHALALAFHGGRLNVPVTVVMPIFAPLSKVCLFIHDISTIHLANLSNLSLPNNRSANAESLVLMWCCMARISKRRVRRRVI